MAGESRTADHPVVAALQKAGHGFSFFQAVGLLQRAFPDAPRVGQQGPAGKECIRFQPRLDMAFAVSDLTKIRPLPHLDGTPRFAIETTFLSLYGAASPLPTYFTEQLMEEEEDGLQRKFLDLFHHRLISLFYRCWEKYRLSAQFSEEGKDFYSRRILELIGLDADRYPADWHVRPVRFVALAGLMTQIPRSAASLGAALSEYFPGTTFETQSFVPRWIPIPEDQRNRLAGTNCRLGQDLSIGEHVYDRSSTFRVSIGPLGLGDFMAFLPPGERMAELREIVDLMNGDALDYEVEVWLRETEVPPLQLSSDRALLGWSTWLGWQEGMATRVRFLVKGWLHGRG